MNEIIDETTNAIINQYYKNYPPVKNPTAYLVVGQPGAGKTQIVEQISIGKNIAFINGDAYRKFYPDYANLYKEYGDEIINITKKFSGEITENLIEKLSDKKINLIIEGTLRTTEVPEKTRNLLSDKQYQVELDVIVVKPEISWLRTIKRYQEMKNEGSIPRLTAKEHHDKVVKNLSNNLKEIYQSKKFSEIKLYQLKDRDFKVIYSMQKTPDIDPSTILDKEFKRKYTKKEVYDIKNEFKKYISTNELNALFKGKIKQISLGMER